MAGKNDNNDSDDKDSGKESEDNQNQDAGAGKETEKGNGEEKLTKADIQTIISESIAAAIKDQITPEMDRRISGAAKTIYKKAGIKDDPDDKKDDHPDQANKDRLELAAVYAETTIKEETGKLDDDEQELIDTLIGVEMSKVQADDGQSVKDIGKVVGASVLKKYKKLRENIENKKIEALRKAGQVINITEPPRSDTKVNDFEQGKKMAEKRHPAKKV